VLGLDPDPGALWPAAEEDAAPGGEPRERAARAVVSHCRAAIDATAPACVGVKLQLARFELLGAPGWSALEAVAAHAREHGLLVIADGKRGDIDVSARAYAGALFGGAQTPFGELSGLGADLATVNPLMGVDAIEPFVSAARATGAGVLVLVRTSNPGARDFEDVRVEGGGSLWELIASIVDELAAGGVGESGLSDVGAVVGATAPDHVRRARELMRRSPFLLPGIGEESINLLRRSPVIGDHTVLDRALLFDGVLLSVRGDQVDAPVCAIASVEIMIHYGASDIGEPGNALRVPLDRADAGSTIAGEVRGMGVDDLVVKHERGHQNYHRPHADGKAKPQTRLLREDDHATLSADLQMRTEECAAAAKRRLQGRTILPHMTPRPTVPAR